MKTQKEVLDQMQEGFQTLETFCETLELTIWQKLKVNLTIFSIVLYRIFVLPLQKNKIKQLEADLKKYQDIPLNVERTHLKAGKDNSYLTEAEIQAFEKNGYIPPFRVVSAEQAAELRKTIEDEFNAPDFEEKSYMSQELINALKSDGSWGISNGAMYQAQRLKSFRDLMRMPAIAHRLASVLGEEVLCWRSQFFEKKPGSVGSFWHQNSLFREVSKHSKLVPTKHIDAPIIQVSAWVALSDVTIENGAFRLMPGTFKDGRLEFMYSFAQDNLTLFLSQVPTARLATLLKAAFFSSGSFIRSQVVFNTVVNTFPDLFRDAEIVNLEMKAGECVLFSSLNMHASFSNVTEDDTRLAFVGRCTPNHVKVFPNTNISTYPSPEGPKEYELPKVSTFQVHGEDSYGYNRILKEETTLEVAK